jgi:hypothetical protein
MRDCHSERSQPRVIPSEARNLALILSSSAQSEIPRFARNDRLYKPFFILLSPSRQAKGQKSQIPRFARNDSF